MPTFADAEAAIAARDYRAALSIPQFSTVGEDACYRHDIQAAALWKPPTACCAECAPC